MRVILLVGEKQSGKSSAAEYINNLFSPHIIKDGKTLINTYEETTTGIVKKQKETLIYSKDPYDLIGIGELWRYCRIYNFADTLKETINNLYGVPLYRLYGTEADKDQPSPVKWSQISLAVCDINVRQRIKQNHMANSYASIRELMQYFASICKNLDPNCFINSVINNIEKTKAPINIIADCRFVNEFEAIQKYNPINIRCVLPNTISHESETDLKNIPLEKFHLVIDKSRTTLEQKHHMLRQLLLNN